MKTARRNLSFIFVLSLILTLFISMPAQAATATSGKVAVTVPKTTLYVGDSKNNSTPITVKYNNINVKSGIKYSTSNKKIATIKNGKIVASKKGTATISVRYKNKTCRFKITVKNSTLNISKKSLSLQKGKTYTFKAYANKTQVKATSVKWTTSNNKIVSVNKNGTIKGLRNGKAVITAKTAYGTTKCTVTVSSHQHKWVDHTATKTVHHDAVYEDVTTPAVTKWMVPCGGCGKYFTSLDELDLHGTRVALGLEEGNPTNGGGCGSYSRSEEVVITPAHTEHKLVKEAYDTTETYVDYQYCSICKEQK
ncbi:MAG: Ig-like domain-containing protein [Muricoprocola sp.]